MASLGRAVIHSLHLAVLGVAGLAAGVFTTAARADAPQSAAGHARFVNTSGNLVSYTLSAVNQPAGGVAGELEIHIHRASGVVVDAHATVTCLTINGNVARVGAVVDRSTDPDANPLFTDAYITVVDNGEGANDPPDLAANVFVGPTGRAVQHCTTGLFHPLFPIEQGNIQVRP